MAFEKSDLREGSLVRLDLGDSDFLGDDGVTVVRVMEIPEYGAVKAMVREEVPQYFGKNLQRCDPVWFSPCEIIEIVRK